MPLPRRTSGLPGRCRPAAPPARPRPIPSRWPASHGSRPPTQCPARACPPGALGRLPATRGAPAGTRRTSGRRGGSLLKKTFSIIRCSLKSWQHTRPLPFPSASAPDSKSPNVSGLCAPLSASPALPPSLSPPLSPHSAQQNQSADVTSSTIMPKRMMQKIFFTQLPSREPGN